MNVRGIRWGALVAANVLIWCVLSFHQTSGAAPQRGAQLPFSNAVEQRSEMIRHLKEINALLKEQNALLRANERVDATKKR